MKAFSYFFIVLLCLLVSSTGFGQTNSSDKEMLQGYYVVVGAYSPRKESYAQRYVDVIKKMGYEADYGFNTKKDLYFVFVDYTENYRASITSMSETRTIEKFHDAWVFVCLGGPVRVPLAQADTEAGKEEEADVVEAKRDEKPAEVAQEKVSDVAVTAPVTESVKEEEVEDSSAVAVEEILIDENAEEKPIVKNGNLSDYSVFFNLVNARNNSDVKGEVQIVDAERSKLIAVKDGGDYIELPDPHNGTGNLTLLCDVFGFRKTQMEINYYHPLKDTISEDVDLLADVYLVNFDLVRYHAGDIVTMYNVYFFNDAALMRPESKYEVNSLLSMLQENPGYAIRIHGHTNGNGVGKIISKGDASSYFALDNGNKEGAGSAKELSKQRAELIRDYLIEQGIEPERIEVKAWGGKRMLYDKYSTKAKQNVRVEVEILSE
ncbi:OmpA family protein [Fulvivirga ligni]|uniref:OmpA family protein n=1 Tax=Fulvivirga ligni TaxID=2904246 RepID=UPI001F44AE19|nr:OmpA family protein [Fulvivirga ligni]UII23288.1 OmpA family protein [Fulvivirga ligni]